MRLQGDSGALKWMAGGNYTHNDAKEQFLGLGYIATNNGVGPFRYNDYGFINNVKSEAKAAFGSLEYALANTVAAQVSARYTKQSINGASCLTDSGRGDLAAAFSLLSTRPFQPGECVTLDSPNPPGPPPYTPVGGLVQRSLDQDNISWRANLSWKPNRDVHLYANVTRGFKSGAYSTIPVVFSGQYFAVPQESVTAYEAGFKVSLADRRIHLAAATFYYDYKNKQIQGTIPTPFGNLPGLVTVPKSRIVGAELEATIRPFDGLSVNGGLTYVDSKVNRHPIVSDPYGADIDIGGSGFPITPKWQGTLNAEYGFSLAPGLAAYVGGGLTYRSSTPSTFGGGAVFTLPAYTLYDVRAGIKSPDGKWRAEIWGRNITNKFYYTTVFRAIDALVRVPGRPATYGVRVSFDF